MEFRMTSSNGEAITGPAGRGAAAPGEPACLVLHGLGGGPYELQPLIAALEAAGLRVLAPIMPGHDGPGPVMPRSSWRDWVATVESAFDQLAADGRQVAVVGFSTGGTLALATSRAGGRSRARCCSRRFWRSGTAV